MCKNVFLSVAFFVAAASFGSVASAAPICPDTTSSNTDCGFLITIGTGNSLTGAAVMGANPYDGSDDALVGIINNSGASYTGSFTLSGTGNGGGLFAFDGDGICAYVPAAYCSSAPTGYEGPITTFSNINASGSMGTVNVAGLANGATTFFSLEGSPASINGGGGPVIGGAPEPGTNLLLAAGLLIIGVAFRKKAIFGL